jgi:hypothetical protein
VNVPSVTDTLDARVVTPALRTRTEGRRRFILRQIRLLGITRLTQGIPQVRIARIDGPVSISHPVLSDAAIEQYPQTPGTELADQCHATLIASLLVGRGGGVLGIDLLNPSNQRPSTFYVGSQQFDPKKVGIDTAEVPGAFRFDTSIQGNWNNGHEYGTSLSKKEKDALLEFLKTL